jgi:hypothetical protein
MKTNMVSTISVRIRSVFIPGGRRDVSARVHPERRRSVVFSAQTYTSSRKYIPGIWMVWNCSIRQPNNGIGGPHTDIQDAAVHTRFDPGNQTLP